MNLKESYSTLGIEPGVDLKKVTSAYRKLAMKYHPDVNKAPDATEKFQLINEAYESIKNRGKDLENLVSSEFQSLDEDFTFANHEVLNEGVPVKGDVSYEKVDVEKFIYLTPEEAENGKELSVQYMVEKYRTGSIEPLFEYETLNITLPAGLRNEQVITIKGMGNETPDYKKSNLNLIIEIEDE